MNRFFLLCVTATAAMLAACGGGGGGGFDSTLPSAQPTGQQPASEPTAQSFNIPKPSSCETNDHPETGLQGQVPAALRADFKGFNCNLKLVGQYQGEGGSWSTATFTDGAGRKCAYHATASSGASPFGLGPKDIAPRTKPGVPVIDITDPMSPVYMGSLVTPAMLDPWESLRLNARRQILLASNGANGGGDSTIDIYDLSGDCRSPQLLSSVKLALDPSGIVPGDATGHESSVSPDGLTYWVGDSLRGRYYAIDITNTTKPRPLATFSATSFNMAGVGAHGLSISRDGNRAYVAYKTSSAAAAAGAIGPSDPGRNGFAILDTSEIQQRKPNPAIKLVSKGVYNDGSVSQHTIPIKIGGKPYIVQVDEGGPLAGRQAACASTTLPVFPLARIFGVSDETNPREIVKLALETHDPKNCAQVLPDITGLSGFTYGSHYCSVDNRENATALACGYFQSGIRVFDIRDVTHIKEIAYFNPASGPKLTGSDKYHFFNAWVQGGPDWCASRTDFDYAKKQLVTMCMDSGLLVLQFASGTWPFTESTPSLEQN